MNKVSPNLFTSRRAVEVEVRSVTPATVAEVYSRPSFSNHHLTSSVSFG